MTGSIPKNGTVAEPGLVSIAPGKGVITIDPVSVCLLARKEMTRVRIPSPCRVASSDLPEGINNCTLLLSDVLVIPMPRFGVNRLSYTPENSQTA